jgi:hypothetical protein
MAQTTWMLVGRFGRWIPTQTSIDKVLVINDGAGTTCNSEVYAWLGRHHSLRHVAAGSRSFSYPADWNEPGFVDATDQRTLGGFGREVGEDMSRHELPSVVVCGSRGGQAVLSPIIEHWWRGPVVCMNAGILTANVPIPSDCFFVFLTMGRDYFPTRDLQYTSDKFHELAEAGSRCVVVHDPAGQHMPTSRRLAVLLPLALQMAHEQSLNLSSMSGRFGPGIQVYSLIAGDQQSTMQWNA